MTGVVPALSLFGSHPSPSDVAADLEKPALPGCDGVVTGVAVVGKHTVAGSTRVLALTSRQARLSARTSPKRWTRDCVESGTPDVALGSRSGSLEP
jgi:hypothetical protein